MIIRRNTFLRMPCTDASRRRRQHGARNGRQERATCAGRAPRAPGERQAPRARARTRWAAYGEGARQERAKRARVLLIVLYCAFVVVLCFVFVDRLLLFMFVVLWICLEGRSQAWERTAEAKSAPSAKSACAHARGRARRGSAPRARQARAHWSAKGRLFGQHNDEVVIKTN